MARHADDKEAFLGLSTRLLSSIMGRAGLKVLHEWKI
jgi:hypothetical protein